VNLVRRGAATTSHEIINAVDTTFHFFPLPDLGS